MLETIIKIRGMPYWGRGKEADENIIKGISHCFDIPEDYVEILDKGA